MPSNEKDIENYIDGLEEVFALDEKEQKILDGIKYFWNRSPIFKENVIRYVQRYSLITVYKLCRHDITFRQICELPELHGHWQTLVDKILPPHFRFDIAQVSLPILNIIEQSAIVLKYYKERKEHGLNEPHIQKLLNKLFSFHSFYTLQIWFSSERTCLKNNMFKSLPNLLYDISFYIKFMQRLTDARWLTQTELAKSYIEAAYTYSAIGASLENNRAYYNLSGHLHFITALECILVAERISKISYAGIKSELQDTYNLTEDNIIIAEGRAKIIYNTSILNREFISYGSTQECQQKSIGA